MKSEKVFKSVTALMFAIGTLSILVQAGHAQTRKDPPLGGQTSTMLPDRMAPGDRKLLDDVGMLYATGIDALFEDKTDVAKAKLQKIRSSKLPTWFRGPIPEAELLAARIALLNSKYDEAEAHYRSVFQFGEVGWPYLDTHSAIFPKSELPRLHSRVTNENICGEYAYVLAKNRKISEAIEVYNEALMVVDPFKPVTPEPVPLLETFNPSDLNVKRFESASLLASVLSPLPRTIQVQWAARRAVQEDPSWEVAQFYSLYIDPLTNESSKDYRFLRLAQSAQNDYVRAASQRMVDGTQAKQPQERWQDLRAKDPVLIAAKHALWRKSYDDYIQKQTAQKGGGG